MKSAKRLIIKSIPPGPANSFIKRVHYSNKVVPNSQLHFGVFWDGKLEGVIQLGPSLDKRKIIKTVTDTKWNEFIEINRLAFTERLPGNSESRALSVILKKLKKNTPIKWVVSFADATRCGDGTIYRASGFKLIGIRKNTGIKMNIETGEILHSVTSWHKGTYREKGKFKPLKGFQLKYIYFVDRSYEEKLAVPIIPFSRIKELGASMYKGINASEAKNAVAPGFQSGEGGSIPTPTLQ